MEDEKKVAMTEAELQAMVAERVKGALASERERIAADAVQKYLDDNAVRAQVSKVVGGAQAAQSKRTGWARFADIAAAALNKAEFSHDSDEVDLAKLRGLRGQEQHRTGQTTSTTAGGYLIPTEEVLAPVDLISAQESLIGQCNNVPMQTGSVTIVTADGDITVYWIPETTTSADIEHQADGRKQESQFTFGRVTLARHFVVARVAITKQAQLYTGGQLEAFLRSRIPDRLRKACEIAMLRGTATAASDPVTGLDTSIATNAIAWDPVDPFKAILDTIYAPEIALPGAAETDLCVTNARGMLALRNVKDSQMRNILGEPSAQTRNFPALFGYPCVKSVNVLATYPAAAGTDSRFYAGDFRRHAHVGLDPITLAVDPYSGLVANLVYLQFEMPFGFTVTSEKAFAYTDIPRL